MDKPSTGLPVVLKCDPVKVEHTQRADHPETIPLERSAKAILSVYLSSVIGIKVMN